jgi:hypothetical protein
MKRRLLNLATGLSLLLGALVVALWYTGDIYYFGRHPFRWSITGEQGTLAVHRGYGWRWDVKAYWVLLAALALPAGRVILARSRQLAAYRADRRRNRVGLCPSCGYDLRATPDRCPECGRATTARNA